jgi:hypothetical protein
MKSRLIRAVQNELWGLAVIATFGAVGGGVMFLTSDWLGPIKPRALDRPLYRVRRIRRMGS